MVSGWRTPTPTTLQKFILAPRFWITVHDQITVLRWRWAARTGPTGDMMRNAISDDTSICSQYIWPWQLEQWTHGKNLAREEAPRLWPACFLPPSSLPMRTAKATNRIIHPSTRHPCICTPLPTTCIFFSRTGQVRSSAFLQPKPEEACFGPGQLCSQACFQHGKAAVKTQASSISLLDMQPVGQGEGEVLLWGKGRKGPSSTCPHTQSSDKPPCDLSSYSHL